MYYKLLHEYIDYSEMGVEKYFHKQETKSKKPVETFNPNWYKTQLTPNSKLKMLGKSG